ncbi:hypothetical protein SAMN04487886_105417 [Clostridium sp. DSM 8431]|uniref:hypothetical protein n=1 Tax=Clostridium sp. DSM 8431 TaxID=1761781 RepID=UPI0008DECCB2|nr:hypothetical protein [Clostridium sp. DSM 8431]SFU55065.1 hypothetical protein SAMN04487886_105417 [Clostridium sp. DSM 8431]
MDEILEKYKKNSNSSYELLRKKHMGIKETILDIFFDQLLTIKDSLLASAEGSYYLFIYEDKSILLVKKKEKIIREVDVTNYIDKTQTFKKFKFDGYIYKKYRKI